MDVPSFDTAKPPQVTVVAVMSVGSLVVTVSAPTGMEGLLKAKSTDAVRDE